VPAALELDVDLGPAVVHPIPQLDQAVVGHDGVKHGQSNYDQNYKHKASPPSLSTTTVMISHCRSSATIQLQIGGHFLQGRDDIGDVLVQGNAQFFHALVHVVPVDAPGEGLVLQLLLDGTDLHVVDALALPDQGYGHHQAAEFVYREQ